MYVYILRSEKDGSMYVGATNNIKERVRYHREGYNISTKAKMPWVLVRVEKYDNISLALRREKFLKSGRGREVLKNLCPLKRIKVIRGVAQFG